MDEIKKESWNKKRIFAAFFLIVVLIVLGYFLKTKVLGQKSSSTDSPKAVKGTATTKTENKQEEQGLNINVPKKVAEKIESLKQEVKGLNIAEIASSSAQVQKIINDIKSLEQYPSSQVKDVCRKICGL